jgi:hypothetical protein
MRRIDMMSGFDDFAKEREQRNSDAEKLASDAIAEWAYLKERAGDFARDGKGIDNRLGR